MNFIISTRNFPSPFNQSSQVHAFSFLSIPCRLSLLPPNDNGIFPSLSIAIEPFPLCPPTFDILTPSVHQPLLYFSSSIDYYLLITTPFLPCSPPVSVLPSLSSITPQLTVLPSIFSSANPFESSNAIQHQQLSRCLLLSQCLVEDLVQPRDHFREIFPFQ